MKISVIIVTRNRCRKLKRVLGSLGKQTVKPFEVVVVDNNSSDGTAKLVRNWDGELDLQYYKESQQGIPYARNKGLQSARGEVLAFVDDDCVVDKNWVKVIRDSFLENTGVGFMAGKSLVLNEGNILARVLKTNHDKWFYKSINERGGKKYTDKFDTKNIAVRREAIDRYDLCFDTRFGEYSCGEDTDFGKRLQEQGVEGLYISEMKVWHEEQCNLRGFLNQGFRRGRSTQAIRDKWGIRVKPRENPPRRYVKWYRDWKMFDNEDNLLSQFASFMLFKLYIRVSFFGKWYGRKCGTDY